MILKTRDASSENIHRLERRAALETDPVTRAALQGAASRLRADPTTEDACALIDARFADTERWAVLHDLRLSAGSGAVHLNHLLVSDRLEFACVDTRHVRRGLEQDASGAFRAFSAYGSNPVASPLAKAARDVRLLGALLREADLLPRRLGIGRAAAVRGVVLTDPSLRIGVASDERRDVVGVFPSDALFPMLWERGGRRRAAGGTRVSRDALEGVCAGIVALHRPAVPETLLRGAARSDRRTAPFRYGALRKTTLSSPAP